MSNFIEFLNVELKEDVLLKFQLPLVITEGRIGKLSIKINMPSNNSEIKIENVLIRVSLLRESRTNYSREEADGMNPEVAAPSPRQTSRPNLSKTGRPRPRSTSKVG